MRGDRHAALSIAGTRNESSATAIGTSEALKKAYERKTLSNCLQEGSVQLNIAFTPLGRAEKAAWQRRTVSPRREKAISGGRNSRATRLEEWSVNNN
jgi:hypothetical protein